MSTGLMSHSLINMIDGPACLLAVWSVASIATILKLKLVSVTSFATESISRHSMSVRNLEQDWSLRLVIVSPFSKHCLCPSRPTPEASEDMSYFDSLSTFMFQSN